jgi:hypothetical protein
MLAAPIAELPPLQKVGSTPELSAGIGFTVTVVVLLTVQPNPSVVVAV